MKKINHEFMKEKNIEIGKKIKARRKELGMTQEELAFKLGYKHKSSIAKIEDGSREVQLDGLIRFSTVLDIDMDQLTGFSEFMENDTEITNAAIASHRLIDDPELTDIVLKISKLKPEKRNKVIQAINLILD